MGMPITIEIIDDVSQKIFDRIFNYFRKIDARFSTYKANSEISQINGGLPKSKWSQPMKQVMKLCEETKRVTNGYFDIKHNGKLDPSGLAKGWAISEAAQKLNKYGLKNFYIEAGGDIQTSGLNEDGELWRIGIRNPFNIDEIIKIVEISGGAVATSGTYIRGQHIYNPYAAGEIKDVASLTVVGSNIYDADRFATAAFAMGKSGINFIEKLAGFEGYLVDDKRLATYTSGFERFVHA